MAKKMCSGALALLVWSHLSGVISAFFDPTSLESLYDQQLLGVNASWPSGAAFTEQDCCDGNLTDPTSLSPFLGGPPTITLKVNHDELFPASYVQATEDSLLSSKYLVMITLYNETEYEDSDNSIYQLVWIQGNMTASTPGGKIINNNTFVTLSNDTEPLLSYGVDFDVSDVENGLRFDLTTWQMSVGVYQQTPELEEYLYADFGDGGDPKQNSTLLAFRLELMFQYLMFGSENPSTLWNSSDPSPWGRVYAYVPGTFDAESTSSSPSATGDVSTQPSKSSSATPATTSHAAATRERIYGGASSESIMLFACTVLALAAGVLI